MISVLIKGEKIPPAPALSPDDWRVMGEVIVNDVIRNVQAGKTPQEEKQRINQKSTQLKKRRQGIGAIKPLIYKLHRFLNPRSFAIKTGINGVTISIIDIFGARTILTHLVEGVRFGARREKMRYSPLTKSTIVPRERTKIQTVRGGGYLNIMGVSPRALKRTADHIIRSLKKSIEQNRQRIKG